MQLRVHPIQNLPYFNYYTKPEAVIHFKVDDSLNEWMKERTKEWPHSAHVTKYVSKWIPKDMNEWTKRELEWWWKELKISKCMD